MSLPDPQAIQALRDARSTYEEAARAYRDAFRAAYPPGTEFISVKHGRVCCAVIDHAGMLDEVRVRSDTGKVYRVSAYHIVGALSDPSEGDTGR